MDTPVYKPQNKRYELSYVVKIAYLHTAGAGRTYSKLLFWESQFSEIIYNSYEQYKPQNDRLELPYVVKNTFSRTAGVRRTRARERPSCVNMGGRGGSNELSHAPFRPRSSKTACDITFIII